MTLFGIIALITFIVGYFFIATEHKFKTHKSAIAIGLGGFLWVLVALSGMDKGVLKTHLAETSGDIFGIIIFLLSAMTLVEILIHYKFFDWLGEKLLEMKFDDRKQFLVMGAITFFLSAVVDNTTLTIIMVQIARGFFKGKNLLVAVAGIVILSNAGGAWSPTGDVNTLMIWLAGKVETVDFLTKGFLPAFSFAVVLSILLARKIQNDTHDTLKKEKTVLTRGEILIVILSLISFISPLLVNSIGLEPYMGRLFGLGLVWIAIEFVKGRSAKQTHVEANVESFLQRTDISSLNFLIGILLAVSALSTMGVLNTMSQFIFGTAQDFSRLVMGTVAMGIASSFVDNVPLTAIAIKMITSTDYMIWILMALAVTTGGSLLIVGSIPGVVAMGMIKELTFGKYMKLATIPVFIAFCVGVAVWLVEYQVIKGF
jgi:Na+/H+ antiporter NhaD/arsenite permease-like protein